MTASKIISSIKRREAYQQQTINVHSLEHTLIYISKEIFDKEFIEGGMKPKILTCIQAMEKGVAKSTILSPSSWALGS